MTAKEYDRERLHAIANEIDDLSTRLEIVFAKRVLIWDRRIKAGDCATSPQPTDRGAGERAKMSRVSRPLVANSVTPERIAKAKKTLKDAGVTL